MSLPVEILELIVDRLADVLHDNAAGKWPRCQLYIERETTTNALVACHGLSHFLRVVTARHLFHDVELRFDNERDETRASQLYDIVCSDPTDRYNVLHHIRNLSIIMPNTPAHREEVYDDVRTWLSHFLDHASATVPVDGQSILLASLHITFHPDFGLFRQWSDLDGSFRAVLCSLCQSKVLTRRLAFSRIANLPRTLFRYASARILELDESPDVDSNLPDIDEPALALLTHARQTANVEEVNVDGEYAFKGLEGVRVVTILEAQEYTFSCLSQWNSTLEAINSRVHCLTPSEMEGVIAARMFPRLERINIYGLPFNTCLCPSHGSLANTTSFNPGFTHLFTALNHLMINQDNLPALRRVNIKLSLSLDRVPFQAKRSCVWYAPGCRCQGHPTMPWSFLDQFFVDFLQRRSITFSIDFVFYMPDFPARPSLVRYWKEYVPDWVLGSVPSILPMSLERFPNNFTFTSACMFDPLAQ